MSDSIAQSEARSRTCKNSGELPCYAFDSAPFDEEKPFLAWHVVWKCWVPIKRRIKQQIEIGGLEWVDATLTTAWPSEAFTHWMPMIDEPSDLVVKRLVEFTKECSAKSKEKYGA